LVTAVECDTSGDVLASIKNARRGEDPGDEEEEEEAADWFSASDELRASIAAAR
jgi:hypothetical protein